MVKLLDTCRLSFGFKKERRCVCQYKILEEKNNYREQPSRNGVSKFIKVVRFNCQDLFETKITMNANIYRNDQSRRNFDFHQPKCLCFLKKCS